MRGAVHTVYNGPGINIRAMVMPGGLLMITENYWGEEGAGLATTFVPMTTSDALQFLMPEKEK